MSIFLKLALFCRVFWGNQKKTIMDRNNSNPDRPGRSVPPGPRPEDDSVRGKQPDFTADEADREQTGGDRSQVDAGHGDDAIEIERNEGRGFSDAGTYMPQDGDLGDESQDYGDLPREVRKNHNYYDASMGTGGQRKSPDPEIPEGMHVDDGRKVGLSYDDTDSYVDESGEPEIDEEKLPPEKGDRDVKNIRDAAKRHGDGGNR